MTNTLYRFQRAGANFLRLAESALLADEMGTGKTIQTIALLELDRLYPALIVCPPSVMAVWEREFAKWAPNRRVAVSEGGTKGGEAAANDVASGAADVLVVNWEALRSLSRLAPFGSIRLETCSNCDKTSRKRPAQCQREDKVLNLIRWAVVVADEAHKAKDPKSQQTRALWAIGDRAERRYALTGTPIANSLEDLWSVMRFVDPPTFPAKWPFLERYGALVPNHFSGGMDVVGIRPDRRAELDQFFLPRFLRRTKAQVLPDLPPKVYLRRNVVLSGKQLKAYKQMEKEMVAKVDGGTIVAENSLVASLRLRQLASAYGEVISSIDWSGLSPKEYGKLLDAIDAQVLLSEPSSKLDELEVVLQELGPDRPAVIFAESRQLLELAAGRLPEDSYGFVTGAVNLGERAAAIDKFQAGGLKYMLVSNAGGEGITLTAADVGIFLQRPWSAVVNKQWEDRLHRIGQAGQSVTYIDIVTVGTVEEDVFEALERKAGRLQDVVQDPVMA